MFCTDCGTQVDEGKRFCKNCGTRIAKIDEPATTTVLPKVDPASSTSQVDSARSTMPPRAPVSETQTIMMASRQRHGISASVIVAAVALLMLVGAGAGVYFGTNLFSDPATTENASVSAPEPMVNSQEPPPAMPIEGDKIPEGPSERDLNAVLRSAPPEPLAAPPTDTSKAKEPAAKPAPKSDLATQSAQPPNQSRGASAQDRVAKAPTPPSAPSRPAFNPGTYETLRATKVFDGPSASARIVAGIERGVRLNVVASKGDWLEVHSRHGNPPGFIRKDDARSVE